MPQHKTVTIPARPSVPCPYVAGTVEIPPNQPSSLLELIHQQINRDCPGTSTEFQIWANPSNQAPIWVGAAMAHPLHEAEHGHHSPQDDQPGPLSIKNYGYYLTPQSEPRIYRSTYPGTSTVIGVMQVFSQAPAKLHVEVQE